MPPSFSSAFFPPDLVAQASAVLDMLRDQALTCATAESCTGGMVAAALTAVAGSSDVFERGYVTYSNEAKTESLGVPPGLIAQHGAVSAQVAAAMAEGCLEESGAALALSTTGIAGPGGGTPDKPVGLVFFACSIAGSPTVVRRRIFAGDRNAVRYATVNAVLDLALQVLSGVPTGDEMD
ncbi:nicotinamide-nucleotide amidohydrolase family protein [Phaeovibrio sulfidiphilus]|uniref:Nicotinamide-nucleotide amidohydrolase family protein n=1 Tax=Phaeovibrio sulfidiphilus TaxID=1220600 RepID=A0A8J6YW04_9PROT|nr:nicotinamide-nucleotide amidohydrolase family protein [Phaeovibrio sulfidiphilus]MBE1236732.1 nicotinamide-nucleotide amidohydrolase family protein [Phaeovibrio sulfidiphilus]